MATKLSQKNKLNQKLLTTISIIVGVLILVTGLVIGVRSYFFHEPQTPVSEKTANQQNTPTSVDQVAELPLTGNQNNEATKAEIVQTQAKPVNIKIFFSKNPENMDQAEYSKSVQRQTNRLDIGTFAIENLTLGPTSDEAKLGYFTPLKLSGESNCDGKDFRLSIQTNIATLQFCKKVQLVGDLDGGRIKAAVTATLTQFQSVKSVVILGQDGNCFNDLSDLNTCKD